MKRCILISVFSLAIFLFSFNRVEANTTLYSINSGFLNQSYTEDGIWAYGGGMPAPGFLAGHHYAFHFITNTSSFAAGDAILLQAGDWGSEETGWQAGTKWETSEVVTAPGDYFIPFDKDSGIFRDFGNFSANQDPTLDGNGYIQFYAFCDNTANCTGSLFEIIDCGTSECLPPAPPNSVPVANAGLDQTVDKNQQVTFDGSGSTDPDGISDIVSYNWDFGDGSTSSGATVNHVYTQAGVFTTTLTVTDSVGHINTDTAMITVLTPAEATQNLTVLVQTYNLQQGIVNSLDTKLQNAYDSLVALNSGDRQDAVNKIQAFISAVQAQSGNKITVDQANTLIQSAQQILNSL